MSDHMSPVRYNCGQSELSWNSKIDEKSQDTLSMNKRFSPFKSEFYGLLEQLEIKQKLANVQIKKVSR